MSDTFSRWPYLSAAVLPGLLWLAGCDASTVVVRADTFPLAVVERFDQAIPSQPVLGSADYLRSRDVLPAAKVDIREPLPPAVPLPVAQAQIEVVQPQVSTDQSAQEQGGVTPAAGMAAGMTNAQGDGERNTLDGGAGK